MNKFEQPDNTTEVSGQFLVAFLQYLPTQCAEQGQKIAQKLSLDNPDPAAWYPASQCQNLAEEVERSCGPHILFAIGKQMAAQTPKPDAIDLSSALASLNDFFLEHHRGEEQACYTLTKFNIETREATIESRNPYSCYLDRGLLSSLTNQYRPEGATYINVEMDLSRPNRLAGSDITFFNVLWV